MLQHTLLISFLFGIVLLYHQAESCNEAVCGSIVSKCLLTQSCKCDLQNCTCCKECFNCLSYLYSECCSCVDMCPKPKDTENRLSKNSHVEDLPEAVNVGGLFKLLTEEQDNIGRWYSISYPVDYNLSHIGVQKEAKLALRKLFLYYLYMNLTRICQTDWFKHPNVNVYPQKKINIFHKLSRSKNRKIFLHVQSVLQNTAV